MKMITMTVEMVIMMIIITTIDSNCSRRGTSSISNSIRYSHD